MMSSRLTVPELGTEDRRLFELSKTGDISAANRLLCSSYRKAVNARTLAAIRGVFLTGDGDYLKQAERIKVAEVADIVNAQYTPTRSLVSSMNFDTERDSPIPTMEECTRLLLTNLTLNQCEVIEKMERPVFQLLPNCGMRKYMFLVMDELLRKGRSDIIRLDNWVRDLLNHYAAGRDERIDGWRIAVIEGIAKPSADLEWDNLSWDLGRRMRAFSDYYQGRGVSGLSIEAWMSLLADAFTFNKESIDNYCPMENTDGSIGVIFSPSAENQALIGSYWKAIENPPAHSGVSLEVVGQDSTIDAFRFRPSVVFEIGQSGE